MNRTFHLISENVSICNTLAPLLISNERQDDERTEKQGQSLVDSALLRAALLSIPLVILVGGLVLFMIFYRKPKADKEDYSRRITSFESLYKQGKLSKEEFNQPAIAKSLFQQVVSKYPNTKEANAAHLFIDRLQTYLVEVPSITAK